MAPLRFFMLSAVAVAASAAGNTTATNATASSCPSYSCGRAVNVRYPFWVDGDGNGTHCGYGALRLSCHRDTPVLRLPSGEYEVTGIHYTDRTLTLYDLLASTNTSCPSVTGRNLTLPTGSPPPFALTTRNTNITFLLDCDFSGIDNRYLVPCLTNGHNHSYIFGRSGPVPYDRVHLCQQAVGMPVLHPAEDPVPAIKAGFELAWSSPAAGGECADCEEAGGFCGERQHMFSCFSSSNNTSKPTKSSGTSTTTTIVIVVVMFVIVVLFMLALIFWPTNPQVVAQDAAVAQDA